MGGRIRYIESEFVSKNCQSSLPGRDLVVNLGIVRWMGWLRCIDFCADSLGDTYGFEAAQGDGEPFEKKMYRLMAKLGEQLAESARL